MTPFFHLEYRDGGALNKKRLFHTSHSKDYFEASDDSGSVLVRLRKRSDYPGTYCDVKTKQGVWIGYGAKHPGQNEEFLRIYISTSGYVRIERDAYCTLPLFYGFSDGVLVVSNIYDEVCASLPRLTLRRHAIKYLLWTYIPTLHTMWEEVHILGAGESLTLENGELHKKMSSSRAWEYSTELIPANPVDFIDTLESQLDSFISTRLQNNVVGFEISGGMDSSLLPLYLAKRGYAATLPAASLIFPPPHSVTQNKKLDALEEHTSVRILRTDLNPAIDHPLHVPLSEVSPRPLYILHELYEAGFRRIAAHLRQQGVSVVVCGIGGDQIFEHIPDQPVYTSILPHIPPSFLIGAYDGSPASSLDGAGKNSLPFSQPLEQLASANIYIEHDIWPVSPFHNSLLYEFCQALPLTFRKHKKILRAYFEANNYPSLLYTGPNESFTPFFVQCMQLPIFSQLIAYYSQRSVTEQLGLVDLDKLQQTYAQICVGEQSTDQLIAIYDWLYVEMELQLRLHGVAIPSLQVPQ